jgi:radical SAM superfamily enzyme YgiQ (UPF0313 family)
MCKNGGMLGKEVFLVPKAHKSAPTVSVAWAFPNTYEVGMSSLGYQLVWSLLEGDADTAVYRGFTDCKEPGFDAAELVGFTLSWEVDYINILGFLDEMGVPLKSCDRADDDPLVFAGGPVLTANPEPFAEFFDVVLLGDAEVTIPAFLAAFKQTFKLGSRREKLLYLAQVDGIYVPSLYRYELAAADGQIVKVIPLADSVPEYPKKQVFDPPENYVAHSLMLAPDTTWGDLFCLEIVRSCPQECRFCLASYLTRPFRAAPVDTLVAKVDQALRYTKKIGLLGPSVTEHPHFDDLAKALIARPQIEISMASVRADSLNPLILEMVKTLGGKSVTIAIESGSERLRAIMKKNLSEEEIFAAVNMIYESGLKNVKFYGMVGLPGEEQADLEETVRLMTKLKKTYKQLHFVFGCSSFVPKAQTPFQWSGRDRKSKEKLEYMRKHLSKVGVEVRPESHNWSDIQALLSRGDRRLTETLIEVYQANGKLGAWHRALRKTRDNCPPSDYYIYREMSYDETLPWSHLLTAQKKDMLQKHSQTAEAIASGISS